MKEEKFTSGRGGWRGGGRPKGSKNKEQKEPTVIYYRRIKQEWVKVLDKKLEELKNENKN